MVLPRRKKTARRSLRHTNSLFARFAPRTASRPAVLIPPIDPALTADTPIPAASVASTGGDSEASAHQPLTPGTGTGRGLCLSPSRESTAEELVGSGSRASLGQGSSRKRRAAPRDAEEAAEALRISGLMVVFDHGLRIVTFLNHVHKNDAEQKLLLDTFGEPSIENSEEYAQANSKITDNVKTYKNNFLKHLLSNVKAVLKDHPEFATMPDHQLIDAVFDLMNQTTFDSVWYYMKGILEYESCADLGKFYIQNVYAQLWVKTKVWNDLNTSKASEEKSRAANARNDLLKLYDSIPFHDDHKDVAPNCFFFHPPKKQRQEIDVEAHKEVLDHLYVRPSRRRPPPPPPPEPVRSQGLYGGDLDPNDPFQGAGAEEMWR